MSYLIPDLPALLKARSRRRRFWRILLVAVAIIAIVFTAYYLLSS